MQRKLSFLIVLLLAGLLSACGAKATLPEMAPEEIMLRSAEAMSAMEGFHFTIDRDGAHAWLDTNHTLSFTYAEGNYLAPDRAEARVRIVGPGLVTNVDVVSVGETQWETNVLTGVWTELPPDWGFNPTILFDAERGLQAVLTEDVSELVLTEPGKLDRTDNLLLYRIIGQIHSDRVSALSGGLINSDEMNVTLLIEPETFYLHHMLINEPPAEGEDEGRSWIVDFSDFHRNITINAPEIE